jgi:hypothetical protein
VAGAGDRAAGRLVRPGGSEPPYTHPAAAERDFSDAPATVGRDFSPADRSRYDAAGLNAVVIVAGAAASTVTDCVCVPSVSCQTSTV